jgi:hypothetical protein
MMITIMTKRNEDEVDEILDEIFDNSDRNDD